MIKDVEVVDLRKICDERGMIMHMLRSNDPHFEKFGEIYFATAYPGVIKGWHEHKDQVQNYAVVVGMIKLVLYDNRSESSTNGELMELIIGENNYQLVRIPTGVINGWKNICEKPVILANCSTLPHQESGEMIRYDPFGDKVPYNWDIVMK